ncbi:hypothetical protein GCK72_008562 [Caenorhabditis remanei]|uniref:F-box domain-containing protein n=1 Tax=Caenorhabditis remanei TaxID=31234 RepID=A0A6A5H0L6_CAERE|nr:hypothetical protein GCK72_008562 [Caenorhabditis remanei]KAF1760314.1 hypothetical protein GCK72_008562 [Caenorhabditis remanei]
MEPTFPIFRLPQNAIFHVLQTMNLNQLFIISLVSTKTKNLVSSLRLDASDVDICISRRINVLARTTNSYLNLDFYKESNNQNELLSVEISVPVAAYVGNEGSRTQSLIPFNFSKWLNHIRTVFCWTKPANVYFSQGCERFDLRLLKDTIGNVNQLVPTGLLTDDSSRKVLKHFSSPSELCLINNPFEEACQIQQIFIQNCKILEFGDVYSLDDMLLINCERADLYHPISQKTLNRFLKHWIRGSNPRLQHMALSINKTDFVNGEVYLNGIKCMEMSEDVKRDIHQTLSSSIYSSMIQIRRRDGTPAVIGSYKSENFIYLHFIVFH